MERGASFLLTTLAVAGLALVVGRLPGVDTLRVGARDSVLALASYRPARLAEDLADPVIVAIDATSMRAYPDWPWSRARHAGLVQRLSEAGAVAIAFDIDFSSPRDPADDLAFARALRDAGNGVLGAFQHFESIPGLGEVEIVSEPLPELRAAARLGSSVVPLEADGSVRHTLPFHRVGEQRMASLALTTFNLATGRPAAEPAASGPFDFRRARPPVETLSYVAALESGAVPSRRVAPVREVSSRPVANLSASVTRWTAPAAGP